MKKNKERERNKGTDKSVRDRKKGGEKVKER